MVSSKWFIDAGKGLSLADDLEKCRKGKSLTSSEDGASSTPMLRRQMRERRVAPLFPIEVYGSRLPEFVGALDALLLRRVVRFLASATL